MSAECRKWAHAPPQTASRYSMTSSANARSLSGTVNPRALAVFVLITSSNLTGVWTGSSLGFSPLRIRSPSDAARRYSSTKQGRKRSDRPVQRTTGPRDGRDTVAISQQSNLRAMADGEGIRYHDETAIWAACGNEEFNIVHVVQWGRPSPPRRGTQPRL